ncbi:MAG: cyclase family protein [Peptococcaceae bacterium]|nr:cyclase family protein [Peptococcaceae bacterium]
MIYDISLPLYPGMAVFPGDPVFSREQTNSIDQGDYYNLSRVSLGSHTGTHIDAPYHYLQKGMTVDQLPIEDLIGEAKVIEINAEKTILPEHLQYRDIRQGDRILFKTRNTELLQGKAFRQDYTYCSPEAACYLREKKVRLIGIDYLSIDDAAAEDGPCHRIFLSAGIIILEGLNLFGVPEGEYDLIALPLKILGCDGSPVRAVLVKRSCKFG